MYNKSDNYSLSEQFEFACERSEILLVEMARKYFSPYHFIPSVKTRFQSQPIFFPRHKYGRVVYNSLSKILSLTSQYNFSRVEGKIFGKHLEGGEKIKLFPSGLWVCEIHEENLTILTFFQHHLHHILN